MWTLPSKCLLSYPDEDRSLETIGTSMRGKLHVVVLQSC